MYRWKHFLWVSLVLMYFAFPNFPVWADGKNGFDHNEALEQLHEKRKQEEKELKRLSEMALIPSGKFVMGRNGVNKNEEPARIVYLDAFFIDKYEVTQLRGRRPMIPAKGG